MALANAKLGAVHGFAGPLGGMFEAPHGALCARLLPYVMRANLAALRARKPESVALARYAEVARLITGRSAARAEDGIQRIEALCQELEIPPLREYGLKPEDFPVLVEKARASSSMQGNPIALSVDELGAVLESAR
jgi:alcohol dehydrogenase class IV